VRRGRIVGKRVGLGQGEDSAGAAEVLEVVADLFEGVAVAGHVEDPAPGGTLQPGRQIAAGRARESAQPRAGAPGAHDLEQFRGLGEASGQQRDAFGQLVPQERLGRRWRVFGMALDPGAP
jgi:hypothetical protein